MHWFVPKEKRFFEMLASQSKNVVEGAKELKNFIDNYSEIGRNERKSRYQVIRSIELKGDESILAIMQNLDSNFRTIVDKDDIKELAAVLDDILDLVDTAASRFVVLGIERIDTYIPKFVDIAVDIINGVDKCILNLKSLDDTKENSEKIRKLEKDSVELYNEALSELFHFYKNSIDIIKYKEVYELLKKIANKCKDAANIIDSISIKHA